MRLITRRSLWVLAVSLCLLSFGRGPSARAEDAMGTVVITLNAAVGENAPESPYRSYYLQARRKGIDQHLRIFPYLGVADVIEARSFGDPGLSHRRPGQIVAPRPRSH